MAVAETSRSVQDLPLAAPRRDGCDDHAFWAELRRLGPLVRDRRGQVIAFSQAHMSQIFSDDVTRQIETDVGVLAGMQSGPLIDFLGHSLLTSNDPLHRARRTPLARGFARPVMQALRPVIRNDVETLLDPLIGAGPVDFVETVAGPLPARVITRILGVPEADIPSLTRLVYSAIRGLSVRAPEVMAEADRDMGHLSDYVSEILTERRRTPRDDFLTAYLARTDDGRLDDLDVRIQIVTLILAGAETTRFALAAALYHLLSHQEAWAALVASPDATAPAAVAEGLRYEPVIGSLARIAARDFHLDDVAIPEGTLVSVSLLAALRDPAVYSEPERFDIARTDHPQLHPIFGLGPHRCLGEALARIELAEALAAIATRAPGTRLAGPAPCFRGSGATRSVNGLVLELA